jgi:hypothetical protein
MFSDAKTMSRPSWSSLGCCYGQGVVAQMLVGLQNKRDRGEDRGARTIRRGTSAKASFLLLPRRYSLVQ